MSSLSKGTNCPCESGLLYEACCGPIILRKKSARTAEELMRSRYTAFTLKDWNYLVATHHPTTRGTSLRRDLEEYDDNPQWCGLKILSTAAGLAKDKTGKVQFEASYFLNGDTHVLAEHSRFKRYKGEWKYLDAV